MEKKELTDVTEISKETSNKSCSRKKEEYKEKKCKVIYYNKINKILDIQFDSFGIRLRDIGDIEYMNTVIVKYKGEIGKPNFKLKV